MKYLAIDYGTRRVGFAHCDPMEIIVSPLCQLEINHADLDPFYRKISQILGDNQIEAIVVGLPYNMDGTEGEQAKLSREFADKLRDLCDLPVHLFDERLSSAAADEMLAESGFTSGKRKARRDMLAACEILRDFLDKG